MFTEMGLGLHPGRGVGDRGKAALLHGAGVFPHSPVRVWDLFPCNKELAVHALDCKRGKGRTQASRHKLVKDAFRNLLTLDG